MASAARSPARPAELLTPIAFDLIEGWADDDHSAAFAAFLVSCRRAVLHLPKTRALGIDGEALRRVAAAALELRDPEPLEARRFFERHFRPMQVESDGFVTGYYEPELAASPRRTERFPVPLYRRPPDLVEVDETNRPPGWDPAIRFARLGAGGLVPHPDRAAIEDGALAGRGLEIAWLRDAVDAYFVHVQGSARLNMTDGRLVRLTFDGKSGHGYTSIGRLAVERGWLTSEEADKAGLEAWLRANPEAGQALMRENRSFIFFRETPELKPAEGPLGAAGVPLTPGRSLAVDRTLWTFHMPVWVQADFGDPDRPGRSFRRLMVAQDTGSAIVGPARGDVFVGPGDAAGQVAGGIRHAARMTALVPRAEGRAA
jgi:membrane-bound lytic murein transglycosylase A